MITSDLIEFIKSQLNSNFSREVITSQLLQVGWKLEDIEEGFLNIEVLSPSVINTPTKESINTDFLEIDNVKKENDEVDPYREIPVVADLSSDKVDEYKSPVISTIDKITPMKIWTPINIEPKVVEVKKEEEKPKVEKEIEFSHSIAIEPYNVEIANNGQTDTIPKLVVDDTKRKQEEGGFIPSINKNLITDSSLQPFENITPTIQPVVQNKTTDVVHKSAMISSYSQDILAASKEVTAPTINKNKILKIGIIISILVVIGGMVFAFVEGYVKFPGSRFSFSIVKKDPRAIMVNVPLTISNLKSYKVDTNINISSPSLSNITTGLSSGEAVTSKDRDYISINTKGLVNNQNNKLNFDYLLNFKSSLLDEDINSDWKYNGSDLYATIPNLSRIIGDNAPKETTVTLKPDQLGLFVSEFSPNVQEKIKEFDIYNILSGEIPIYVKNETFSIFKEFINGLEYTEKADENIHGVDTYHYELTANRSQTKRFLTSLMNLYVVKLTSDQKKNLEEALGSSVISSFEIWTSKNDDNFYQVKFTVNTPLSQVLGLNDSGIAGNEVKLDFITTFYDLNVSNDIKIPEAEMDMNEYINSIRDIKIKNIISNFKTQTIPFKNAVGSFGSRSNPTGSCTNPNPGSIFSPKGHVKGADGAISSISSSMNNLLSITNGVASCYSTSGAWALSSPLLSVTDSLIPNFFCTDSTGNTTILTTQISGPTCLLKKGI